MTALWVLLALLGLFALILTVNAVRAGLRRPKRPHIEAPVSNETSCTPLHVSSETGCTQLHVSPETGCTQLHVSPETASAYAEGLGRMLACATVSRKGEPHDDREFAKLRRTVEELFPLFHERAEKNHFGADCWVYRLPGRDHGRRIMLMSHHDVVDGGDPAGWKHPPFGGEVHDGAVWGRGAVDTKGPLYAEFQAVEELLAQGWEPPCDLFLASSHNEEFAGDGIPKAAEWFRQKGLRFDLILDEGGGVISPPMPGVSCDCAMIAVHEKGRLSLVCKAEEAAAHPGLSGRTDTPVARMAGFIAEIGRKPPFKRRLYPEVRAMFTELCPYASFPMRLIFANLWCFGPLLVRLMPRLNPQAGAMTGTRCAFRAIQGDGASRACRAEAFLRCVRDTDLIDELRAFQAAAEKYGVKIYEGDEADYHTPADLHSDALRYVRACCSAVFPDCANAPYLLPAGTDARHFSDLSDAVLRFAPIRMNPQQFASVHGVDENLDVKALADAVVFYKYLLEHYR